MNANIYREILKCPTVLLKEIKKKWLDVQSQKIY